VDAEIKEVFKKAISRYYLNSQKKSLKLTYTLMLRDYFSTETYIKNGVEIPRIDEEQELPTYQQFYYWYMKNRDIKREISSRINLKLTNKTTERLLEIQLRKYMAPVMSTPLMQLLETVT